MSVKAMNWVWENSLAVGNDLLVLLAIADRCNDEGDDAWPALSTLMAKTRLSESTVRRSIVALTKLQELEVKLQAGPNGTNRYRIRYITRTEEEKAAARRRPARKTPVILTPSQFDRVSPGEPGGVSTRERGGVSRVKPDPSSTPSTSVKAVPDNGTPRERRSEGSVRAWVTWWCERYFAVRGVRYLVVAQRDMPNVRRLLATYGDEMLKAMGERLLVEKSDSFIVKSERGIGVLITKANWLAERATQTMRRPVWSCPHESECLNPATCELKLSQPDKYPVRREVSA